MEADYDYALDIPPDYIYEDIYDDYGDYYSHSMDYNLKDLCNNCLLPTLSDGFWTATKIMCSCLFLKFTVLLNFLPEQVFHLTSASLGLLCLYRFFATEFLYIITFAVVGYSILRLSSYVIKQHQGSVCAVTCFVFLIVCELFFADKKLWHRIRGCQMLLSMKLISLAYDMRSADKDIPSVIPCFGYLFHVGSVIFGPWISYTSYAASRVNTKVDFDWVCLILRSLLYSFGFLTVSTCWSSWLLYSASSNWITAYRDALSFRSSHYFVSYLSEATVLSSGIQKLTVTAAFEIEIPRSLVEVVIWWNVPMHFWLKTYVWSNTKSLGTFMSRLLTFLASSLLHGLNFQLAAVLLSLGFYTYIEYKIRRKFSDVFEACIEARKCKPNCRHLYKSNNLYVKVTNLAFGILSIFHLAYLGAMFDSSSNLEEEGYSMNHTLQKWTELKYLSHWVAFFCYLFHYLIQ